VRGQFRWFVRERALEQRSLGEEHAIGEVEVAASGDTSRLSALETAVGRGPAGAIVASVDRVPAPNGTSYPSPFRIER
jgi:hypothetical protein